MYTSCLDRAYVYCIILILYTLYTFYSVIITPNVTKPMKNRADVRRKPRPEASDLERYANVIKTYRELLRLSALSDDIRIGRHGRCVVPEDRGELLEWVASPKNLDLVAESFRRVCSGYVSTGRLFAVDSGVFYVDWPAISSMLQTCEDTL